MWTEKTKLRKALGGGPESAACLEVLEGMLSAEQRAAFEAAMLPSAKAAEVSGELDEVVKKLRGLKDAKLDGLIEAITTASANLVADGRPKKRDA